MLSKVWQCRKGYNKGMRIEEHIYSDGSKHYSLIDRCGTHNCTEKQAERTIKFEEMEDVTLGYIATGWIK